ncbi:MAG: MATE family efflux transporter [Glaciecola sp.]
MPFTIRYSEFFKELKVLSSLAWPLLIAQVTQTLMGVADTIMAGRYSSVDMAGVAIGVGLSLPLLIFIQGICMALTPVVSRYHGAKQIHNIANQVQQMLYLVLTLSCIALVCIPLSPMLVRMVDMPAELLDKTTAYLQFILLSAPGFAVYQCMRNYCEGLSLTRPTMIIMGLGLLVNIPMNYIFINGLFGMPELGGVGCGLATMMVFYTMAFATVVYAWRAKKLATVNLFQTWSTPSKLDIQAHLTLGLPIALTLVFEVSLFAIVAVLLAPLGTLTVAAHQITLNVSSLIFMLPLSIGLALAIRVGFLVGEGRPTHTKLSYWAGMLLAVSTVLVTATIIVLFNQEIAALYTTELPVITAASGLLLLAALFQFSDAIQVVSANALRGYKDTKAMFIISFVAYWLVGFPVGIILGLTDLWVPKMAAAGFWIGFITGLSVAAVMMFMRVKLIQARLVVHQPHSHT